MLGRKKYGQQGWSRKYGFNVGDLTICADVLQAYLSHSTAGSWPPALRRPRKCLRQRYLP
jgi:dynein heavy chain